MLRVGCSTLTISSVTLKLTQKCFIFIFLQHRVFTQACYIPAPATCLPQAGRYSEGREEGNSAFQHANASNGSITTSKMTVIGCWQGWQGWLSALVATFGNTYHHLGGYEIGNPMLHTRQHYLSSCVFALVFIKKHEIVVVNESECFGVSRVGCQHLLLVDGVKPY